VVEAGELLTYFCYIFILDGVVTFTICFFLQEKYKEEVVKNTAKTSTMRRSPLTTESSMAVEAKKHMDGEIDALFYLTLLIIDTMPLTTVDCFFWNVCSVRWGPGLQGGNAAKAKFVVHVFWSYASCISDTLKL
jgi:hypothetical protein